MHFFCFAFDISLEFYNSQIFQRRRRLVVRIFNKTIFFYYLTSINAQCLRINNTRINKYIVSDVDDDTLDYTVLGLIEEFPPRVEVMAREILSLTKI